MSQFTLVARADRQAVYTAMAVDELESALRAFRGNQPLATGTRTVDGARVDRLVSPQPAPVGNAAVIVDVTVTPPESGLRLNPVRMVGHAYR
jgi:hypothetical protein